MDLNVKDSFSNDILQLSLAHETIKVTDVTLKMKPCFWQENIWALAYSVNIAQAKMKTTKSTQESLSLHRKCYLIAGTETPLIAATRRDLLLAATIVLQKEVDVNATDTVSRTPIIIAAELGSFGLVKCLIEGGADISIADASL